MNAPAPFAFGQTVYVAVAHAYAEHRVPCPICFGQRFVTLILGNGESQPIECEGCGLGYEGPRGWVNERRTESRVEEGTVTGMVWEAHDERWRIEVRGNSERETFATREEAEARRAELHAQIEEYRAKNWEEQMNGKKKHHAWSARYHRGELAEHRRRAAYHEAKLADPRIRERKSTT